MDVDLGVVLCLIVVVFIFCWRERVAMCRLFSGFGDIVVSFCIRRNKIRHACVFMLSMF